jgi:ubiquinone/menaquinone biosynthesis C-methylase UbiE
VGDGDVRGFRPVRTKTSQDKAREIEFFDQHADGDEYNVFAPETNHELVERFLRFACFKPGDRVLDLGCGSGVFAAEVARRGMAVVGVDLSTRLLERGRRQAPAVGFAAGDAERLPFPDETFAGVLLSGLVHHLPDPSAMAREVHRVLRPGGRFMAFDPNRRNPAMWAYRDWSSPFYSSIGVTENERPVLASQVRDVFASVGFRTATDYFSARYRYVASERARWLLPAYNMFETIALAPRPLRPLRAFVLSFGEKQVR